MYWSYWQFILCIFTLSLIKKKAIFFWYNLLLLYYLSIDLYSYLLPVDTYLIDLILLLVFHKHHKLFQIVLINMVWFELFKLIPDYIYQLSETNQLFYLDALFWYSFSELEAKDLTIKNIAIIVSILYLYISKGIL